MDELLELKTLHYGRTTYPPGQDERGAGVRRRADALPAVYMAKANQLDQQLCATPENEVGPIERRLLSYGPVRRLVFGHWYEA